MKTMYQIKSTNRQNFFGRNIFKILTIFITVLIFVFIFGTFSPLRSIVVDALSPLFGAGNSFYNTVGWMPKFFSDKNNLIEKNTKLTNEIESLRRNVGDYESVKYENQKLRENLGMRPTGNFISALIVAKPPQIPLDSLFLDKGMGSGIKNGDFVLVSERILIGKIVKTSQNRATATLNSFAGIVTYGFVARTDEPLEIKGAGGGSMEAKVPINFDIVVGDKIIVGGSLNYLAAIAGVIEEDSSSGFKNILMSLPADVSKADMVFVEPIISE